MPDTTPLLNYGVTGIMLGIFIWLHIAALRRSDAAADARSKECAERERCMNLKLDANEKFHREVLLPLVEESVIAAKDQTIAAKELKQAIIESRKGSGGHPVTP